MCNSLITIKDGETKVLAAALYRFGEMPFDNALTYVKSLDESQRVQLADVLLKRLDEHDIPLRELEYATYTFDLVMDQGAYAEFKRHRMMTQTPQMLTTRLGIRDSAFDNGSRFQSRYEAAMECRGRDV